MMNKIIFLLFVFFAGALAGAYPRHLKLDPKPSDLPFYYLKPRLLLVAQNDIYRVEPLPEITFAEEGKASFKLMRFEQRPIIKGRYYRVIYVHSFASYKSKDPKNADTVYEVLVEELNAKLQATGIFIKLGAKLGKGDKANVPDFKSLDDQLSRSPTLQTGRAQVNDHVMNASAQELNGVVVPAYSKFKVLNITKTRLSYRLAHKYKLILRNVVTNEIRELEAPGLTKLPNWALIVAPENARIVKLGKFEIHY